jgi:hypothetical protein
VQCAKHSDSLVTGKSMRPSLTVGASVLIHTARGQTLEPAWNLLMKLTR